MSAVVERGLKPMPDGETKQTKKVRFRCPCGRRAMRVVSAPLGDVAGLAAVVVALLAAPPPCPTCEGGETP